MKTDKKTLDELFEERQHTENHLWKIKSHIREAAEEYILEILKGSYKRQGTSFMSYGEIISKMQKKEPKFTLEDIDQGLFLLNRSGIAKYVTIDNTTVNGMKLTEDKK